jgi:uncharacterized integral membrane protein
VTRRGWIALIAAALVVAAFAYQNRHERAALLLGPFSVYAVPLGVLLLVAFLLGMAAMLALSLPTDRRNRELLRAHGLLDAPAPSRGGAAEPAATRDPVFPSPADHPASD